MLRWRSSCCSASSDASSARVGPTERERSHIASALGPTNGESPDSKRSSNASPSSDSTYSSRPHSSGSPTPGSGGGRKRHRSGTGPDVEPALAGARLEARDQVVVHPRKLADKVLPATVAPGRRLAGLELLEAHSLSSFACSVSRFRTCQSSGNIRWWM